MRNLVVVILLFIAQFAFGQDCEVVVFNQEGEAFQVTLNGKVQNDEFDTHVRVRGLMNGENYTLGVRFKNASIPSIDKKILLIKSSSEYTYIVKQGTKGSHIMRMISVVPLEQVHFNYPKEEKSNEPKERIKLFEPENTKAEPAEQTEESSAESTEEVASSEDRGCTLPMNDGQFSNSLKAISSRDLSIERVELATKILESNCFTTEQLKKMFKLFGYENDRLKLAKLAYSHTVDQDNFSSLYEIFDFKSSIRQLESSIASADKE